MQEMGWSEADWHVMRQVGGRMINMWRGRWVRGRFVAGSVEVRWVGTSQSKLARGG